MSISNVLKIKYPNTNFVEDCILQDDGKGAYIKYWNTDKLGKKPTKAQLNTWANDENIKKQVYNNEVLATRKSKYGPWQEQQDMLYHDKKEGTTTWFDHVTDVKTRYPKQT